MMKTEDRNKLIQLLASNQGAPIQVQFGDVSPGEVVRHDEIVLLDSHAAMIRTLHDEGYSLYLGDGKLKIDKH